MKLPKLEDNEKYVGLYVFDFGDHAGLGFTAREVAELLESEKYKNGKAQNPQGLPRRQAGAKRCADGDLPA
ncbi:MAG: hypothetical protein ACYSWO_30885 [Planctomycetota bacterium]|jgi:hypothetical protein